LAFGGSPPAVIAHVLGVVVAAGGNMAYHFATPGAEHLAGGGATYDSMSYHNNSEDKDDIPAANLLLAHQLIADDPPAPLVRTLGNFDLTRHRFPDSAST
jgi:hypothetical protein